MHKLEINRDFSLFFPRWFDSNKNHTNVAHLNYSLRKYLNKQKSDALGSKNNSLERLLFNLSEFMLYELFHRTVKFSERRIIFMSWYLFQPLDVVGWLRRVRINQEAITQNAFKVSKWKKKKCPKCFLNISKNNI